MVVGTILVVDALARRLREEAIVLDHGTRVGCHGLVVHAQPDVDVRRHVDDVPRRGHETLEASSRRQRAVGPVGRLDGVDVEMVGTGVTGCRGENALERRHDLRRVLSPLDVGSEGAPVQRDVHQGVGKERAQQRIVGETPPRLSHRVRVGHVECTAILGRRIGETPHLRLDQRALDLGRAIRHRQRPLRRLVGLPGHRRVGHRPVDVRAQRVRHAPVRHGAVGVEPGHLVERPQGLVVVEAPAEREALVEVRLRQLGVGRHLAAGRPQPVVERRRRCGTGHE